MKHSEIQIPSSALDFYVKLYCRKRQENKSKVNNVLAEATKSWLTLSKSEKHHFTAKYQQIKSNIRSQFANQLKNAVPYLKKKVLPVPRPKAVSHSREDVIEREVNTISDVVDQTANSQILNIEGNIANISDIERNITDANSFCEQDANHVIENPIQDQYNKIFYENDRIAISEPIPPKLLTGEQLFNMVNETNHNLSWAALTTVEKRKYQNAVLSIKRNYLKEYKKYLEQLPSEKLYKHYKNNVSLV